MSYQDSGFSEEDADHHITTCLMKTPSGSIYIQPTSEFSRPASPVSPASPAPAELKPIFIVFGTGSSGSTGTVALISFWLGSHQSRLHRAGQSPKQMVSFSF